MYSIYLVLLGLSDVLTTRTVYGTSHHDYFSFLLVHSGVVFLELDKAKNEVLLTQTKHHEQNILQIQLVIKNDIHHF